MSDTKPERPDLDAIEARSVAPVAFKIRETTKNGKTEGWISWDDGPGDPEAEWLVHDDYYPDNDSQLERFATWIYRAAAAYHHDVPALVAYCRRLEQERDDLLTYVDDLENVARAAERATSGFGFGLEMLNGCPTELATDLIDAVRSYQFGRPNASRAAPSLAPPVASIAVSWMQPFSSKEKGRTE